MKRGKNINKINVKIMPSLLKHLNLPDNNKTNIDKKEISSNKSPNKYNSNMSLKNRIKFNSIKKVKNPNNFYHTPKRLNTINLIDKKIDILYDWNILLSNKSPGIYYNKADYKKLAVNNYETDNNNPRNSIVLLDLPEKQINKFFGKHSLLQSDRRIKTANVRLKNIKSNTNNNISSTEKTKKDSISKISNNIIENYDTDIIVNNNLIHPMSIYTPRDPYQPFYFSKDFNNYYKYDFKYFSKNMPSLRAKIKTSNKKLVKEITNLKYNTIKDSSHLKQFLENDEKIFKIQDLIIAGIRNNPLRLMKNLYMLKHPNYKALKQDMKKYFKTMKPIGEYFDEIDFTQNERWRTYHELKKLRKKEKVEKKVKRFYTLDNKEDKSNLILSYYKVNDPQIKYFNGLLRKYNNLIKSSKNNEYDYYNNENSFNKSKSNKMIETESQKDFEFYRDKLILNGNGDKKKIETKMKIGNEDKLNYKNYFLTETTKNTNNEL